MNHPHGNSKLVTRSSKLDPNPNYHISSGESPQPALSEAKGPDFRTWDSSSAIASRKPGAPCPDFRTWDLSNATTSHTATTPGAPSSSRLYATKVDIAQSATFHRRPSHPTLHAVPSPQGPTARHIPAQAEGLGNARNTTRGLKARHITARRQHPALNSGLSDMGSRTATD